MPAWVQHGYIGMKMLNVFPQNSSVGLPAISGLYLLSEGQHGQTLACIAGNELTRRRTAAASALAARYLAKTNAQTLLIVGTGQVAPMLIEAHAAVRPIQRVLVWGRNPDKVKAMVDEYQDYQGDFTTITQIEAVSDLAKACAQADIISCATLSKEPIVRVNGYNPAATSIWSGRFAKICANVMVKPLYAVRCLSIPGQAQKAKQAICIRRWPKVSSQWKTSMATWNN